MSYRGFDSIHSALEGETVSEITDRFDTETVYKFFNEGRADPEIQEDQERVLLDSEAIERAYRQPEIEYSFYEFVQKMAPTYHLGKLSARNNDKEESIGRNWVAKASSSMGVSGLAAFELYQQYLQESQSVAAQHPNAFMAALATGFGLYYLFEGREHQIRDNVVEEYVEDIEEVAGDYEIETF